MQQIEVDRLKNADETSAGMLLQAALHVARKLNRDSCSLGIRDRVEVGRDLVSHARMRLRKMDMGSRVSLPMSTSPKSPVSVRLER